MQLTVFVQSQFVNAYAQASWEWKRQFKRTNGHPVQNPSLLAQLDVPSALSDLLALQD